MPYSQGAFEPSTVWSWAKIQENVWPPSQTCPSTYENLEQTSPMTLDKCDMLQKWWESGPGRSHQVWRLLLKQTGSLSSESLLSWEGTLDVTAPMKCHPGSWKGKWGNTPYTFDSNCHNLGPCEVSISQPISPKIFHHFVFPKNSSHVSNKLLLIVIISIRFLPESGQIPMEGMTRGHAADTAILYVAVLEPSLTRS